MYVCEFKCIHVPVSAIDDGQLDKDNRENEDDNDEH